MTHTHSSSVRVSTVSTARLDLVSLSPAFLDALLAGRPGIAEGVGGFAIPRSWPDEHDARFLALRLGQMRKDPAWQPWLARAIVMCETRDMAGHIGFHGPPNDGFAEMGYTVFERYRRRGIATEAIRGMMDWAASEHGVRRFRLSISPENAPSLALADKFGFTQVGEQIDEEDGLEYVFELNVQS